MGASEQWIYWNASAVGTLIVVVFAGLGGTFLMLLRPGSTQSRLLGAVFLSTAVFNCGYLFASLVVLPAGALHRWVTVPAVLVVVAFFAAFLARNGPQPNLRLSRWIVLLGILGVCVATSGFVVLTLSDVAYFDFAAHYWDFANYHANVGVAILITIYLVCLTAVAIYRAFQIPSRARVILLALTVSFLVASAVPSVTNLASRSGTMARALHQSLIVPLFVLGLFLIAIVYVNTTDDRTTFMAKIVGVSVATFLLLFQMISIFALDDRERAYDASRSTDLSLQLISRHPRHPLRYLNKYTFTENGPVAERLPRKMSAGAEATPPHLSSGLPEARNTLFLESLKKLAATQ